MPRRPRDAAQRLRSAVDGLPTHTKEAMLRGVEGNRIIVGAYVDPTSGGICPMLAAHRNGGRTSVATFARAWDEYTEARRPRRATRREVRVLRSLLEASLARADAPAEGSVAELAAQIRAERERLSCNSDVAPNELFAAEPAREPADEPEISVIRVGPAHDDSGASTAEPEPAPAEAAPPRWAPFRAVRTPRRHRDLLAAAEEQLTEDGGIGEDPAPPRRRREHVS